MAPKKMRTSEGEEPPRLDITAFRHARGFSWNNVADFLSLDESTFASVSKEGAEAFKSVRRQHLLKLIEVSDTVGILEFFKKYPDPRQWCVPDAGRPTSPPTATPRDAARVYFTVPNFEWIACQLLGTTGYTAQEERPGDKVRFLKMLSSVPPEVFDYTHLLTMECLVFNSDAKMYAAGIPARIQGDVDDYGPIWSLTRSRVYRLSHIVFELLRPEEEADVEDPAFRAVMPDLDIPTLAYDCLSKCGILRLILERIGTYPLEEEPDYAPNVYHHTPLLHLTLMPAAILKRMFTDTDMPRLIDRYVGGPPARTVLSAEVEALHTRPDDFFHVYTNTGCFLTFIARLAHAAKPSLQTVRSTMDTVLTTGPRWDVHGLGDMLEDMALPEATPTAAEETASELTALIRTIGRRGNEEEHKTSIRKNTDENTMDYYTAKRKINWADHLLREQRDDLLSKLSSSFFGGEDSQAGQTPTSIARALEKDYYHKNAPLRPRTKTVLACVLFTAGQPQHTAKTITEAMVNNAIHGDDPEPRGRTGPRGSPNMPRRGEPRGELIEYFSRDRQEGVEMGDTERGVLATLLSFCLYGNGSVTDGWAECLLRLLRPGYEPAHMRSRREAAAESGGPATQGNVVRSVAFGPRDPVAVQHTPDADAAAAAAAATLEDAAEIDLSSLIMTKLVARPTANLKQALQAHAVAQIREALTPAEDDDGLLDKLCDFLRNRENISTSQRHGLNGGIFAALFSMSYCINTFQKHSATLRVLKNTRWIKELLYMLKKQL